MRKIIQELYDGGIHPVERQARNSYSKKDARKLCEAADKVYELSNPQMKEAFENYKEIRSAIGYNENVGAFTEGIKLGLSLAFGCFYEKEDD